MRTLIIAFAVILVIIVLGIYLYNSVFSTTYFSEFSLNNREVKSITITPVWDERNVIELRERDHVSIFLRGIRKSKNLHYDGRQVSLKGFDQYIVSINARERYSFDIWVSKDRERMYILRGENNFFVPEDEFIIFFRDEVLAMLR